MLVLASAVNLRPESRGTHDHSLLSQIRDSPNLESQVPVLISLRSRVARLYPQALGSLFVAFYYSQGYGGGIRTTSTRDYVKVVGMQAYVLILVLHNINQERHALKCSP
jgi:hypothetical protein